MSKTWGTAFLVCCAVAFLVLTAPRAMAVSIDGVVSPSSEWIGTYLGTDPNEGAVPDDWDISDVFAVSDDTYVNFRMDVWGTPTLDPYDFDYCFYQVHMDLDMDPGTGRPIDGIGAEYVLDYRKVGPTPTARLFDTRDGGWTYVADETGAQVGVTELRVLLTDMGVARGQNMIVVFGINNGGAPPDDLTDLYQYVIPEPSLALMVLGGLAGLLGFSRRRR